MAQSWINVTQSEIYLDLASSHLELDLEVSEPLNWLTWLCWLDLILRHIDWLSDSHPVESVE